MDVFGAQETSTLVELVALHNPDQFPQPHVKALIWKCKGIMEKVNSDGKSVPVAFTTT